MLWLGLLRVTNLGRAADRQDGASLRATAAATLRAAVPDDLTAIEDLLRASQLPVSGVESAIGHFIVAESHGRVVGAIGVELYEAAALLRSAVVEPSMRGTGLGAALVSAIVQEAERQGVEQIFLLTTTAENYFPRFGFGPVTRAAVPERVKTSVEFRGACPSSAIVMMRNASHLDE